MLRKIILQTALDNVAYLYSDRAKAANKNPVEIRTNDLRLSGHCSPGQEIRVGRDP